jgi:predicted O-methyltransferase YrrM
MRIPFGLQGWSRVLRLWTRHPLLGLGQLSAHDYCSPGLGDLPGDIERYFPSVHQVMSFNPRVPHISREDKRQPGVGFVTWDESTVLMNVAKRFSHGLGLEIGCWMGWSTVCLALSDIHLDVIDPGLGSGMQADTVRYALQAAGVAERVNLVKGLSPEDVHVLGQKGHRWTFCFIDGDHAGDAPRRDISAVLNYCEPDCAIMCHDTINENVYEAMSNLAQCGWQVTFLQTAVGLGIAWRGKIDPPQHIADPAVNWRAVGLYPDNCYDP